MFENLKDFFSYNYIISVISLDIHKTLASLELKNYIFALAVPYFFKAKKHLQLLKSDTSRLDLKARQPLDYVSN